MIIKTDRFFKLFTPKWVSGIALYPFILLRKSCPHHDECTINHERIHIRQQIEMLVIPFYFWYIIEWCWKMLKYKDRNLAYRNISFEREAYENEANLKYLSQRRFWSFLKYI